MATAKKTTKKPAVKKAPRTDYKIGARVKVMVYNNDKAEFGRGFTVALHDNKKTCVRETPTGKFIAVNLGDKKSGPTYNEFRPARVVGF